VLRRELERAHRLLNGKEPLNSAEKEKPRMIKISIQNTAGDASGYAAPRETEDPSGVEPQNHSTPVKWETPKHFTGQAGQAIDRMKPERKARAKSLSLTAETPRTQRRMGHGLTQKQLISPPVPLRHAQGH